MFSKIKDSEKDQYFHDTLPTAYIEELPNRISFFLAIGVFVCVIMVYSFLDLMVVWFYSVYTFALLLALMGFYLSICNIKPKLKKSKKLILAGT